MKTLGVRLLILSLVFSSYALAGGHGDIAFHHGKKVKANEFIIKLKNPLSPHAKVASQTTSQFMARVQAKYSMQAVTSFSGLNLHHMRMPNDQGKSIDEIIADLQSNPEVAYVEPNYIFEKASFESGVRSAAYTQSQVTSMTSGSYGLTSAPIQAQSTWPNLTPGGTTSVVAVIDTGIDFSHPSFAYSIWTNPREVVNGIDDDGNGFIDDVHGWNFVANSNNPADDDGHGTHVSGIILGVSQDIFSSPTGPGVVQIMPLKFLDANGSGSTSDAIKAIYYAANNGATVMNNSWGGGGFSNALEDAINYAYGKDSVFVAAAGNNANNNDSSPTYPANYGVPNVVPVAASDDFDYLASFSNYGKSSVDLSAPGVSILSTWPGGYYMFLSGTSMATPFVTGTVALMRHQSPTMNSYQLKNIVMNAVDQKSNLSSYVQTGGRLNVLNSVNLASTTPVDSYKPAYTTADRGLASARQGGCGMISRLRDEEGLARQVVVALALLVLPLVFAGALKPGLSNVEKRKYPRFNIDSEMKLKFGNQELTGSVRTISLGGTEINTEALLREGSVISMVISSPDGRERVEVQGHVVWSQSQKRYGVAFKDLSETVRAQISQWTTALNKAA